MKKVAVFGNAGGGKSTLARRLAELTGLPLYVIDKMRFRTGGVEMTIFPDARSIIKGVSDPAAARSLYSRYIGA